MQWIPIGRLIQAPQSLLWDLLTDTRQWNLWGPSVAAVQSPQRHISRGTKGKVKTRLGVWLPFEVTHYAPPTYWAWRVAGVRATGHRLTPLGPNACRLVFEVPLWAAPYVSVCGLALVRIARIAAKLTGGEGTAHTSTRRK